MNLCKVLETDADHLVQKVHSFDKSKIKYPCIVQEKYDGVYCIACRENGEIHIFSRTGKEYFSMHHLKDVIDRLLFINSSDILIFEAYCDSVPQSTISGWCRDEQSQHPEIKGIAHDCLTYGEYFGRDKTTYKSRFDHLTITFDVVDPSPLFELPEQITAQYYGEVESYANTVWGRDGEGIVIKNPNAAYKRGKRNYDLMKLKREVSYDLKVVALEEGKGKYKGMVGKLVCQWKNGKTIKVGSGLTDKQRKAWWDRCNYTDFYKGIVGKIVQIDAMGESSKGQLREPFFKGVRYDKEKGDF